MVIIFFVGGYTSKIISAIFMSVSVYLVINGIYNRIFIKKLDKDERNISIEDKAKAMAFDIMGIVFGILIIIYGFIMANLLIILFALVAYLIIFAVYMIYFSKYHKEM
ncbi:hypothetical protein CTDIVETGP_2151 [Clostridium tyrobutyricum DIVETGP]|uniref:Uncharacterized protein n=1 Tax=Clostridium tyrobutyricum DIVETGP TaxID=1408889 RepID=W6N6P8_CLOTY|nr:MMPL family transporter [Clostridium tyrobutyricum]AND83645.1 hypothetical protein CTK_C03750 [Clostridium tyrobutyricum]MEA5009797.1 MMPL family transporter [Clostridium tyrobutyricum]CDL92081.1 hypothetical protein CTDIVETGP_2151 [Clostridium tyrobutyricum DIVETGP]